MAHEENRESASESQSQSVYRWLSADRELTIPIAILLPTPMDRDCVLFSKHAPRGAPMAHENL
jgi:hypothetical protein